MLINVVNLKKSFGKNLVLKGVNIKIESGSITALLGPNGAGKTTTINILVGLLKADAGEIFYGSKKFSGNDVEIKSKIGVVPQYNNVDRDLTVYENWYIHAILYGLKKKTAINRIEHMLTFTGLKNHRNKKAGILSGGMKRRLVIGRALLHNPKILFLDEPTTGLDPATKRHLWDFVKKINLEFDCTVVLTTHIIEEAEHLSDYVYFLSNGLIIKSGIPEKLKNDLGKIAVEFFDGKSTKIKYFSSKEVAMQYIKNLESISNIKIREVNLEDVYLQLTGERIEI